MCKGFLNRKFFIIKYIILVYWGVLMVGVFDIFIKKINFDNFINMRNWF